MLIKVSTWTHKYKRNKNRADKTCIICNEAGIEHADVK